MQETASLEHFEPEPEHTSAPPPEEVGPETSASSAASELLPFSPLSPSQPALPPEAQGEANGGPLGCCLGVTIGLFLSLSVAILSRLYADQLFNTFQGYTSVLVRIVLALVAIGEAIFFGYIGWKVGKRLYREYEPPVLKTRNGKRKPRPRVKRA